MKMKQFLFVICLTALSLNFAQCAPSKKTDVTGQRLKALRDEMKKWNYGAYIIPSEDEHQSEYVSTYDRRREWISAFTGSAGVAVVTADKAALWTDGRYFLQADDELDDNWILQKQGVAGVPSVSAWIGAELKDPNFKNVGLNARLTSIDGWKSYESAMNEFNIKLVSPETDLIDKVWTTGRPSKPNSKIFIHDIKYAGRTWKDKADDVVKRMKDAKADIYVVTALDEVAWLFNLRGSDIPYNPMFYAYGIVDVSGSHRLYVQNMSRITDDENLVKHLSGVTIAEYNKVFSDIEELSNQEKVIWVSPFSSFAVLSRVVNKNKLINDKASPIRSIKAVKNQVEIENARKCQIRDSAYRIMHMKWLEDEMKKGTRITEIESYEKLEEIEKTDPLFKGLSFNSISAVGPHASVIHYSPGPDHDSVLMKDQIYLLDAGAQFDDCSTDITRTHHYGTPTDKEIFAYTRVLQGAINLASIVFPNNVRGRDIDVVAREPLWRAGLDYNHGTGHGIGYFLSIHEAPPGTNYRSNSVYDEAFKIGMFQSDEPGYYQDNVFGIRLETDIEVVQAKTLYDEGRIMYTFEPQTLIPFEKNLIDVNVLTKAQIDWLNEYNRKIRDKVGGYLHQIDQHDVYEYLLTKTEPFGTEQVASTKAPYNSSQKLQQYSLLMFLLLVVATLFKY